MGWEPVRVIPRCEAGKSANLQPQNYWNHGHFTDAERRPRRMFKKASQRGRSERGGEAYSFSYVEPLSDARTKLEDFFNIVLN
jgi:hypothetical protein